MVGTLKAALGELDGWQTSQVKVQETAGLDARAVQVLKDGVSRVILTSVGEGPIRTKESLIQANGDPVKR